MSTTQTSPCEVPRLDLLHLLTLGNVRASDGADLTEMKGMYFDLVQELQRQGAGSFR
jgi:hypothetical protein